MELKNSHRLNKIRIWPFSWEKENVTEALLEWSQLYKARALLLGLVLIKTTIIQNSYLLLSVSVSYSCLFWGIIHFIYYILKEMHFWKYPCWKAEKLSVISFVLRELNHHLGRRMFRTIYPFSFILLVTNKYTLNQKAYKCDID